MFDRSARYAAMAENAEAVVLIVLPVTIFAFAMGSSSILTMVKLGGPLRWLMLGLLFVSAVPYGVSSVRRVPLSFLAVTGCLVAVAVISSLWSVDPGLSGKRAFSFALLLAAVTLVGAGALEATRRPERLFMALVAAADTVAVAGLIVLLVDHNLAVQAAAPHMPARLRGFGQNPNTASMLFAVALPIAVGLVVATRSVWMRAAAGMSCLLLYGSIVLSDSRGALIAAAGGTVLFLALTTRSLRRLVPVEALAIVFFLATFQLAGHRTSLATATVAVPTTPIPGHVGSANPGGPGGSQSSPGTGPSTTPPASRIEVGIRQSLPPSEIPVPFVPRQDEIGYPLLYTYKPILGYGSGRVFAWLTAIRTGLRRPTLGYGFGTEPIVFIDRFYIFQGEYTENSFIGMFLQLGIVGTLLLLLPFVLVGRAALLARRRNTERTSSITAAAAGVAVAGFVVAFFQSYLYSVGNVATLTFWVCAVIAVTSFAASPENA